MEEKKELLDQDERVVEIELERLRGFVNHPFKVQADSQMIELQESIKKYGILNPLIVRPRQDGTYEIISGYRGKFVAEKIGYRKHTAVCGKEQKRFIRFRSLGEDFTEENLKKVIAGEKESPERNEKVPDRKEAKPEKHKFDLVVDIQEKWHRERTVDMSSGRKNIM